MGDNGEKMRQNSVFITSARFMEIFISICYSTIRGRIEVQELNYGVGNGVKIKSMSLFKIVVRSFGVQLRQG